MTTAQWPTWLLMSLLILWMSSQTSSHRTSVTKDHRAVTESAGVADNDIFLEICPENCRIWMGGPGPPGEKVSGTQMSEAPDAPEDGPGDDILGAEDSDLVPSVTLAVTLILLFLLLSAWLVWPPCQASY